MNSGTELAVDPLFSPKKYPKWYDDGRFRRGQQFFQRHIAGILLSMHFSLIAGFSLPNLLEPLVFTKASDKPRKSLRRYVLTAYHIYLWLSGDVWSPHSQAAQSLRTVRRMHASVARQMREKEEDRIYVSQYDMGLVQSGFFAAVFLYPERFGVRCTQQEREDYAFAWRVIGYLLGVHDEYNISSGSYERIFTTVKNIEQECLIPSLRNPPPNFHMILEAYVDGMNLPFSVKLQSKESVLAMTLQLLKEPVTFRLSWRDRLRIVAIKLFCVLLYWCPGFESFVNKRVSNTLTFIGTNLLKNVLENEQKKYL